MTKKEFDNTRFYAGMKIKTIDGSIHDLIAIDFELGLFGINDNNAIIPTWIDIKDCELIN